MSVEILIEQIAAKSDSAKDLFVKVMLEKIASRLEEKKVDAMADLFGGKEKILKKKPAGKQDSSKSNSLSAKRVPKDKYGI